LANRHPNYLPQATARAVTLQPRGFVLRAVALAE
jgi:hypothetical protein